MLQSEEVLARKTDVLLKIATAGGAVEDEIARHARELDAAAVRLLERRIETAQQCDPAVRQPCAGGRRLPRAEAVSSRSQVSAKRARGVLCAPSLRA